MRDVTTYMLFILFFSGQGGGSGFLFVLFLGDDVSVLAHLCSKCLQNMNPLIVQ